MDSWTVESEAAFDGCVGALTGVIGHADRAGPLRDYCLGLMLPVERKSVEPPAAVTAPSRVSAKHQSLLHFVGQAGWSDEAVLGLLRDWVLPQIGRHGPIRAWIIDDTGFPEKGKHSVGVARQYCGQLGRQDNCQVAVSLSVANDAASLPIAWRLCLPQAWSDDPGRRQKAKIPNAIVFQTRPQIALDQIRAARAENVPPGVILAGAGYGADGGFRAGLSEIGLACVVGVQPTLSVWRPGEGPLPPKPWSGKGRPRACAGALITSRSPPKPWPRNCRQRPGPRSPGGTEPGPNSAPAAPRCLCAPPRGTSAGRNPMPRNGS